MSRILKIVLSCKYMYKIEKQDITHIKNLNTICVLYDKLV